MRRPAAPASTRMVAIPRGVATAVTKARRQMIARGVVRAALKPSRYTATAKIARTTGPRP
jgi:hypothetical protein